MAIDNHTTKNPTPVPTLGQIWRGTNARYGAGAIENAVIVRMNDAQDPYITLRFKDGNQHGALPDQLNSRYGWHFVSHHGAIKWRLTIRMDAVLADSRELSRQAGFPGGEHVNPAGTEAGYFQYTLGPPWVIIPQAIVVMDVGVL